VEAATKFAEGNIIKWFKPYANSSEALKRDKDDFCVILFLEINIFITLKLKSPLN